MSAFLTGLGTVVSLELRQRVRGAAWYVLLIVFFFVLLIVTGLAAAAAAAGGGSFIYSVVTYVVLLMATLVSPALSGGAINGDREAGTLAPVQVTLLTTGQIVLGKFLAAWLTGLSFLAVAAPFMVFAALVGASSPAFPGTTQPAMAGADTIIASLLVLVLEVGVIAAIGVGLSGLIAKPVLSVVTTYLVVAALSIGTVLAFGLGGSALSESTVSEYSYIERDFEGEPTTDPPTCITDRTEGRAPRFDRVWGFLAANPYVILADATPLRFNADGYPVDLFTQIAAGIRAAQVPPEAIQGFDECEDPFGTPDFDTPEEAVAGTVPSWFVGLGIHLLLAAGALTWAWARTHTPARKLSKGTRIA